MFSFIRKKLIVSKDATLSVVRQRHICRDVKEEEEEEGGGDFHADFTSPKTTYSSLPLFYVARTPSEILQNFAWLFSASFFVFLGDGHLNLLSILLWDQRIRRKDLYVGVLGVLVNAGVILHASMKMSSSKSEEENEAMHHMTLWIITLGILSFCLVSWALWPIWSFLSIPLLFTLLMASMVLLSYVQIGAIRPQILFLHVDCFHIEKPQRISSGK